jgi:putative intracellular protease/amidase
MATDPETLAADHHMRVDLVKSTPKKVLIVVANPTTATTTGWPVGFWAEELTHPYYELTERGIEVTVASPDGARSSSTSCRTPATPRNGRRTTSSHWASSARQS